VAAVVIVINGQLHCCFVVGIGRIFVV